MQLRYRIVESIEQLKELIAYVQNLRQGFVTNFYLDEEKHAAWIRTGEFQYDKWEDTVFVKRLGGRGGKRKVWVKNCQ